jgi:hypothetical protein
MAAMVTATGIMLLTAVVNLSRVAKAKLEVQNLAEATAMAVASLPAKSINVVVDRNEWLNHLYPEGTPVNKYQLPKLSDAAIKEHDFETQDSRKAYAQLVLTINKAQEMFAEAYNGFMGAGDRTQSQASGVGSLAEVLHEIAGLHHPDVRVIVFNNQDGEQSAEEKAEELSSKDGGDFIQGNLNTINVHAMNMQKVEFETEEIYSTVDKKDRKSLTEVMFDKNPPQGIKIGWKHPKWDQRDKTLNVKNRSGVEQQIGAGAIVIKKVRLTAFRDVYVRARAVAYVVRKSGEVRQPNGKPPKEFKPTYYVRLG